MFKWILPHTLSHKPFHTCCHILFRTLQRLLLKPIQWVSKVLCLTWCTLLIINSLILGLTLGLRHRVVLGLALLLLLRHTLLLILRLVGHRAFVLVHLLAFGFLDCCALSILNKRIEGKYNTTAQMLPERLYTHCHTWFHIWSKNV